MGFINNLTLYIVFFGVFINLAIGIGTGIDFTALMVRSIIVTIVFFIMGEIFSSVLRNAVKTINQNKEEEKAGSNFDVKVPPDNDEEFIDYSAEDEEFKEINPAYLHKTEKNE